MSVPTQVTKRKKAAPQWLTVTELDCYLKATHGVSLYQLKGNKTTFQVWAKKVGVRRREFKFVALPPKKQKARVAFVEFFRDVSYCLNLKPAHALKLCRYEFNVSDVRKHIAAAKKV